MVGFFRSGTPERGFGHLVLYALTRRVKRRHVMGHAFGRPIDRTCDLFGNPPHGQP